MDKRILLLLLLLCVGLVSAIPTYLDIDFTDGSWDQYIGESLFGKDCEPTGTYKFTYGTNSSFIDIYNNSGTTVLRIRDPGASSEAVRCNLTDDDLTGDNFTVYLEVETSGAPFAGTTIGLFWALDTGNNLKYGTGANNDNLYYVSNGILTNTLNTTWYSSDFVSRYYWYVDESADTHNTFEACKVSTGGCQYTGFDNRPSGGNRVYRQSGFVADSDLGTDEWYVKRVCMATDITDCIDKQPTAKPKTNATCLFHLNEGARPWSDEVTGFQIDTRGATGGVSNQNATGKFDRAIEWNTGSLYSEYNSGLDNLCDGETGNLGGVNASYEFWFYPTQVMNSSNAAQMFVDKSSQHKFFYNLAGDGSFSLKKVYAGTTLDFYSNPVVAQANKWHHIGLNFYYDGSQYVADFYLDGNFIGNDTGNTGSAPTQSDAFAFGEFSTNPPANAPIGIMDEYIVYQGILLDYSDSFCEGLDQNSVLTNAWCYSPNYNVTLISPANGNVSSNVNQSLQFNLTNGWETTFNASCDLYLDGILNQSNVFVANWSNPLNFTLTDLADGLYNWSVNCSQTGSTGTTVSGSSVTWNFTIDTGTPATPTLNSPANGTIVDADNFIANATCTIASGTVGVRWYLNGINVANGSLGVSPNTDTYNFTGLNYQIYNWTADCISATNISGSQATERYITTRMRNTGLSGSPTINKIEWTWVNPINSEFVHNWVFINGSFVGNTTSQSYNLTGLTPGTTHNITIIPWNGVYNGTLSFDSQTTVQGFEMFNCSANPIPFCVEKNWTGTPQCYECGNLRYPISCVTCGNNGWRIRN